MALKESKYQEVIIDLHQKIAELESKVNIISLEYIFLNNWQKIVKLENDQVNFDVFPILELPNEMSSQLFKRASSKQSTSIF